MKNSSSNLRTSNQLSPLSIQAHLINERDGSHYVFGALDVTLVNTVTGQTTHLHPQNPDKFTVLSDDYATASSEFFQRWNIYCARKFHTSFRIQFSTSH